MQQCHPGAIGDLRSAVPDPDAVGRRDPQERLPAPQDAALGDLAVERVVPLGLGVSFGGPRPAGGLVGVDAQLAHGALRSSCRRCSPSSTTTTIGRGRIGSRPPVDRLRVASTPPPTGASHADADLAGAGWRGRTPGGQREMLSAIRAHRERGRQDSPGRPGNQGHRGVQWAEAIAGPYDSIARAQASGMDELGRLVVSRIQAVAGVTRTLTCTVLRR